MKRKIKLQQTKRRTQQRENWAMLSYSYRQENVKSSCCNQQNDNAESQSIKFSEK